MAKALLLRLQNQEISGEEHEEEGVTGREVKEEEAGARRMMSINRVVRGRSSSSSLGAFCQVLVWASAALVLAAIYIGSYYAVFALTRLDFDAWMVVVLVMLFIAASIAAYFALLFAVTRAWSRKARGGLPPATADIMDDYSEEEVQMAASTFRDYGRCSRFCGLVETVDCYENNNLLLWQKLTEEDGTGRVLVVDGGGSLEGALFGYELGSIAVKNGWQGVIINGAIRDSGKIACLPLGCKALGTVPVASESLGLGEEGVPLNFAGVTFRPGQYVYADGDGIVVSEQPLIVPRSAVL